MAEMTGKKKSAVAARKRKGTAKKTRTDLNTSEMEVLLGYHLRRAMSTLIRSYNRNVFEGKIRPGLASLLRLVVANHGASQVDLARALQVDKATLVSLIDSAEEKGWLRRQRSNVDRRRHEVIPTPKGEGVAAELARQTMANEKKFRRRFSEEEFADLIEYLERIYRSPG